MIEIMEHMWINGGLKQDAPNEAHIVYKIGDYVLLWRKKIVEKRIVEWLGPFEIEEMHENNKLRIFWTTSTNLQALLI